jgi:leishmanolysin
LENNGFPGPKKDHLEKTIFGNEIMVYQNILFQRFSIITLSVATDSGWYEIENSLADEYTFGKDKGCGMFGDQCQANKISEFCEIENRTTCSDDLKFINKCTRSVYSGHCLLNMPILSVKSPRPGGKNSFKYGLKSVCLNCQVVCDFF